LTDNLFDERPSNGLAFSCRKRAAKASHKNGDRAREAVNCNAGLGGLGCIALWCELYMRIGTNFSIKRYERTAVDSCGCNNDLIRRIAMSPV